MVNDNREDVTGTLVTVSLEAMGIKFELVSSTPNPFPDLAPEWVFKEGGLPHGVNQVGLNLEFDSILRSKEQEGTYTITFGNHSTYFQLLTQGMWRRQAGPKLLIRKSILIL